MRDPLGAILRNKPPLAGVPGWMMGAFRDAYPDAFAAVCREVNGFAAWPSPPWFVVRDAFLAAEPDEGVRQDWQAAFELGEGLDYPLERMEEALQHVRKAVNALYAYADRTTAPALAREARLLASSLAHAFATVDDDVATLPGHVEAWRDRLSITR